MSFLNLLPSLVDNNILLVLKLIHIPSRYVELGGWRFFTVTFRHRIKFLQYSLPYPSWQSGAGSGSRGGGSPFGIPPSAICFVLM